MNPPKRYLVTAALPYANGPLHIGHLAGAYLPADIYVRYLRLMDKDVVFVCGSDEHGAAITVRAKKEGSTPQAIIDKYHQQFEVTFRQMGISFDIYHRTSVALHHETSQDFFRTLYKKGEFVEKTTEQYYDETAQQFLADRYIIGTCPKCQNPDAYGDQCEKCGSSLNPTDLINPRSTLSGAAPVLKPTAHWYLPLDKYEKWLRKWIETGKIGNKKLHDPDTWKNHVLGQCKSWLDGGLQPRAMTRDLEWGVDVPTDIPNAAGKKLYVWMDAPIGYVSATKQWAADNGKDWELYWKDEETSLLHFIGKDNIVFHCLIFPAILRAHGDFILPKNVPANQFMNLEGNKISTSKNWAVWIDEYLADFGGRVEELRYNMIKNMPEQKDSEFTWKNFQETTNNELVNNLANFVHRVVVLTHKYFDGKTPVIDVNLDINGATPEPTYYDVELLDLHDRLQELCSHLHDFDFRAAILQLMEISTVGNQLLQANEPWSLYKTDPERTAVVLNLGIQIIAALSVACRPFLPATSDKLRALLQLAPIEEDGELLAMLNLLAEGSSLVDDGHPIGAPAHLFTRIDDTAIAAQVAKLQATVPAVVAPPAADFTPIGDTIQFEDFGKIDLRTGIIRTADKVKGADKLLHLTVDIGLETRHIVSGIAQHFAPDTLIGKAVLVVTNLAPRKLRGIESQGMLLLAEDLSGNLHLVGAPAGAGAGWVVK